MFCILEQRTLLFGARVHSPEKISGLEIYKLGKRGNQPLGVGVTKEGRTAFTYQEEVCCWIRTIEAWFIWKQFLEKWVIPLGLDEQLSNKIYRCGVCVLLSGLLTRV